MDVDPINVCMRIACKERGQGSSCTNERACKISASAAIIMITHSPHAAAITALLGESSVPCLFFTGPRVSVAAHCKSGRQRFSSGNAICSPRQQEEQYRNSPLTVVFSSYYQSAVFRQFGSLPPFSTAVAYQPVRTIVDPAYSLARIPWLLMHRSPRQR